VTRWKIWAIAAVLLGLATAFASLSFAAAIDLGYDDDSRGKKIIVGWGYAMLALLPCSMACALLAWRSYRMRLRG
jgi:hypothetical protein